MQPLPLYYSNEIPPAILQELGATHIDGDGRHIVPHLCCPTPPRRYGRPRAAHHRLPATGTHLQHAVCHLLQDSPYRTETLPLASMVVIDPSRTLCLDGGLAHALSAHCKPIAHRERYGLLHLPHCLRCCRRMRQAGRQRSPSDQLHSPHQPRRSTIHPHHRSTDQSARGTDIHHHLPARTASGIPHTHISIDAGLDHPLHDATACQTIAKHGRHSFLPMDGGPNHGYWRYYTFYRTQPRTCDYPAQHCTHHTHLLLDAILYGPPPWTSVGRPNRSRTSNRTEEYRICNMDGLHLPHACHSHCRRFLQCMAQYIQLIPTLQKAQGETIA